MGVRSALARSLIRTAGVSNGLSVKRLNSILGVAIENECSTSSPRLKSAWKLSPRLKVGQHRQSAWSIAPINPARLMPRSAAMASRTVQNSGSKAKDVAWPERLIERLRNVLNKGPLTKMTDASSLSHHWE